MFDRIILALNAAKLTDNYKAKFIEQEVTDDIVVSCLQNREDLVLLNEIIPVAGHRIKFISEFRKTEPSIIIEQQEQIERPESPEIIILDDNDSDDSSRNSSQTTTTTTTQAKVEPSLLSSFFAYLSFQNSLKSEDFTTVIKNAYGKAIEFYTDNMNELLGKPGMFLDASVLSEKHLENKSKAVEEFSTAYEEYKISMSQVKIKSEDGEMEQVPIKLETENEDNFNAKLIELNDDIDKKCEEYQEKNELRRSNYISKAKNFVSEAEKMYINKMKKFIDTCTEEDELREIEREVNKEAMKFLNEKIQNPSAKIDFINELNEELKQSINNWFEDHLELFQLKRDEDEIVVSSMLETAKNCYNEQMDQQFNSCNFIEPSKLLNLNQKFFTDALKISKLKNSLVKLTSKQEKQFQDAVTVLFLKYEEKNLFRKPGSSFAIGIDLGTTYSCVAVYRNGKTEVIFNENGNKTTPSIVSFQDDGSVIVGDAAKDLAYRNPQNTIFDAKRLIGRDFRHEKVQENLKSWPFVVVNENKKPKIRIEIKNSEEASTFKNYHCEEISALVLKKMKKIAEEYLGCPVKDAVVTVPALFNDYQRQATRDAGEIAGLNVMRIINEPTAAAISYNVHRTDDLKRNVLVFDLGGGTFDVVVLQIVKGEINVKSVHGDTHLGGQDFDTEMIKYCIESFKKEHGIDLARGQDSRIAKERFDVSSRLRRIRSECERQKRVLSSTTETVVGLDVIDSAHPYWNLHVPFTRELFESLNQKMFDHCIEIVQLALSEAKMSKTDIDDIVLVGGSTRIPKIQIMLSDFFEGKVLSKSINPDESVAVGAAIQACILIGQRVDDVDELKLQDVTPFSIGIENSEGKHVIQIPKNSPLPFTHTEIWRTAHDNQTGGRTKIYEGEDTIAVNNNKVGEYLLDGIPPNKAGVEKLRTTTSINKEGIIHVKDTCVSSGTSNELTIKTFNNRMTQKEIKDAKASIGLLMG